MPPPAAVGEPVIVAAALLAADPADQGQAGGDAARGDHVDGDPTPGGSLDPQQLEGGVVEQPGQRAPRRAAAWPWRGMSG